MTPNDANIRSLGESLQRDEFGGVERGFLLQIGSEIYPVYGNDQAGWSIDAGDLGAYTATPLRYRSLEELFFALVNFMVAPIGRA
jgi:hypothetical protein